MDTEKVIELVNHAGQSCSCSHEHHPVTIEQITVKQNAYEQLSSFLTEKKYKNLLLIADKKTFAATGKKVVTYLEELALSYRICLIEPNEIGDVVADEQAIVQALLEIHNEVDCLLAVGSGTLHDITRFCGAKTGKPFISIPTAASVDGFTSLGAPLIIKGVKKTFPTASPIALFADIEVLAAAPKTMTAAGVGDMMAKFTSLADWKFGHLMQGEPYCPLAVEITKNALDDCMLAVDKIAREEEEGLEILMNALIQSGLAMLMFGQSHPASGGEHHLSHYWEMEFLQKNRRQVLHGAKVGVSTILLTTLYSSWYQEGKLLPSDSELTNEVQNIIEALPHVNDLTGIMEQLGGPTVPEQLGIEADLLERSLKEAYLLRDQRFTMLKSYNVDH
ncbi:glycerol-1-phosphate dehydrogenase [NAD(P)+] [Lederbergia galactosidilyticus]|uniref:sn-glycerol-1-phosphate dehydrogenase n=1 Tax=Lederbergia galactosidilytica TaxID=217031 RepID=UPI001AE470BA|nr:sn-glycerol-1-phosphate dehydrogenase [Lederbergia galactosidilytica]MBP1913430.1 glycerol-1-phosphate dehydrogenase [NAD(P)+] [Lederbergia galactosidilytica]